MKTIEVNLYEFHELSAEAKAKAVEKNAETAKYSWYRDAMKSLNKFTEHFGADLSRYEIDFYGGSPSYARFDVSDYAEYQTKETELKQMIQGMGSYNKKTLKGKGDCKFTGFCMDEDATDGARRAYFKGERSIKELLNAGFNTWLKAAQADYRHQISAEGFAEDCEANGWTFEADGTMNNG